MTGDHGLSIMKPPRTTARIHVRASLVMAGIAVVTAACSSSGGGASTQATSGWGGGSNASPGSAGGASLATNATGLGIYDGKSEPAGIDTAANWLGSPSSIRYAMDFIDATDWDHI